MQLTGKQIVEQGIVKNACEKGIQQQGIDVRIENVKVVGNKMSNGGVGGEAIGTTFGYVPVEGKTQIQETFDIEDASVNGKMGWLLQPGYYEVTLMESCNIPLDKVLNYKTRSSLVRNGATVYSGQFDGGFKTDAMGCFLDVRLPLYIEKGARIAQAIVTETYKVAEQDAYDGQWQGDKQRK